MPNFDDLRLTDGTIKYKAPTGDAGFGFSGSARWLRMYGASCLPVLGVAGASVDVDDLGGAGAPLRFISNGGAGSVGSVSAAPHFPRSVYIDKVWAVVSTFGADLATDNLRVQLVNGGPGSASLINVFLNHTATANILYGPFSAGPTLFQQFLVAPVDPPAAGFVNGINLTYVFIADSTDGGGANYFFYAFVIKYFMGPAAWPQEYIEST